MITVAVVVGVICLIVCTLSSVLIAVAVFRTLSTSFSTLDRAHSRWVRQNDRLLNAVIAKSPSEFIELQSLEEEDEGGFYAPGEQEGEVEQVVPGGWGSLRPNKLIEASDVDTERLLNEDFNEDMEPRRRVEA